MVVADCGSTVVVGIMYMHTLRGSSEVGWVDKGIIEGPQGTHFHQYELQQPSGWLVRLSAELDCRPLQRTLDPAILEHLGQCSICQDTRDRHGDRKLSAAQSREHCTALEHLQDSQHDIHIGPEVSVKVLDDQSGSPSASVASSPSGDGFRVDFGKFQLLQYTTPVDSDSNFRGLYLPEKSGNGPPADWNGTKVGIHLQIRKATY